MRRLGQLFKVVTDGRCQHGLVSNPKQPASLFRLGYASNTDQIKLIDFKEMNQEVKSRANDLVIIDVREKPELIEEGKLPATVNVPYMEFPNAFLLDEDDFEEKYGFSKPQSDNQIIIHCKKGVRAMNAAKYLKEKGFSTIKVYPGTEDWVNNGGKMTK